MFVDGQVIGDERLFWLLSVLDLDYYRPPLCFPGHQFLAPPALIPGATQPQLEAFRQKSEYIEYGRFAAAVGAEQHCQRRQISKLDTPQGAEVLHFQIFNTRWSSGLCRN